MSKAPQPLIDYMASERVRKLLSDNSILVPGSIVITDKEAALKLKKITMDIYELGFNIGKRESQNERENTNNPTDQETKET